METIPIRTKQRGQFVDITEAVAERLTRSGVKDGVCVVYSPHTTAGITVNEHADPDVAHDILLTLDRLVPKDDPAFRHNEGNSDSHIKATLMGSSATVFVRDGRLQLGTWQGIFFCEFDGPRSREAWVQFREGT